ncbi:MAG: glutamate formimidoyltransferase [Anaerolineae bacterium]|nr:glutamate formimidoyltransferase [Anaerolineae bacterium]
MPPIMECVPNFSEGRNQKTINAILQSIQSIAGINLLHHTSDTDHNRTVVTFAGEPLPVVEAAFAAIKTASELIDMEQHQGVHPRLGAADVIPFVPLKDMTLADCVAFARQLGQRVGEELKLPVYLYEAAALHPERRNLATIRRGQYEGLKETITQIERQPDFGSTTIGKAGAVVIGARKPLIAFNIYLTTADVTIAQHIAKAIRYSSGGLAGVKALGLLVQGQAQVSMNLTDYRRTPIFRVVEMIRSEAHRYGVSIHHAELIGLIPQDALLDSARWYLQLQDSDNRQILEHSLNWGAFSIP